MAGETRSKKIGKAPTSSWVVPLDALVRDAALADPARAGGKASRLAWLARNAFSVPETWVISATAFAAALRELPPSCEPHSLLRAAMGPAAYTRAAEAREQILAAPLPGKLEEELGVLWNELAPRAPWGLAVRSSATCEDGALTSMAGLAESVLGVRGKDALSDAVRRVWASIASGRALGYLANHGVRDVGMAVVVQPVVKARAAGVMFTRARHGHGRSRERIVNAGFGLGAPVVDGVAAPDMLRLREDGTPLEATIVRKPVARVVGDEGLVDVEVPDPDAPALDAEAMRELADVARRLEDIDDVPWDVEFAVQATARPNDAEAAPRRPRVVVVQARHVTGLGFPEGGTATTVWSSANVGEALPGVATPFTWSVASDYSESGFRKAFATLGCSVPKNTHLVASVHGRIYLNLSKFMDVAAQVPWIDPRMLVELGGGSGGDELAERRPTASHRRFYARLPLTSLRLLREQRQLDATVAAFEGEVSAALRLHEALDLAILPDEGIVRKLHEMRRLLARTGDVMLTCASTALGAHLVLRAVLRRVDPSGAQNLVNELTRGIRDLESARPALGIMRLVRLLRREPDAVAVVERDGSSMDDLPDGPTKRALASFLSLYGDRAVREAELSTPRWKEDTRPVLAMLRVALRASSTDVEPMLARAKSDADASMQALERRLHVGQRQVVRTLVARVRTAARRREQMRAWVTRVLGMMRQTALEADRRLLRLAPELADDWSKVRRGDGLLATTNTVFFLTMEEVTSALHASRTDLAPLVRARRAEFARDLARPDPPPTFIGAPPEVLVPPSGGHVLRGTGASPGVVTGRARVLSSPDDMSDLEPGEVLVVRTTDVGWTPLFCVAAGVVTELGGPLSHAAVVARELGVPSVVNVEGATRAVRTGDRLRVDGDHGVVERIDPS